MNYEDYDDELVGEAPCEFCGDLYPLCLLIEHQTTHLDNGHYFENDLNFLGEVENENFLGGVENETINTETVQPNQGHSFEKDLDLKILANVNAITEPRKVEAEKQMLSSVSKLKTEVPVQPAEISNQISDSKPNVINDSIITQPHKDSKNTVETKKSQFKNRHSQVEEFTTEKGEKLLVYGADIDPVEDLENEKQSYEKPNNPLLSTITKEDDVIDINSLSDDDCDESLEEFWKRARDFLKRNRGRT